MRRLSAPQVLSRLIQRAENHGHFHLTIKRGDYIAERSVSLEPVCESRAVLVTSLQLGVSVQSHQVHITRGTLTYFDDDDFLAFLMGHAMAHIHLDHDYQSTRNQLAGTLAGFVIDSALFAGGINTGGLFTETGYATGREVYSDRRERQANHYGAYFAARAGYDLSALDQWGARYASEPSESFIPGNSHRLSLSQLESLDLVRDHIARQRAQGLDLSPHHMSAPDL